MGAYHLRDSLGLYRASGDLWGLCRVQCLPKLKISFLGVHIISMAVLVVYIGFPLFGETETSTW